MKQRRHAKGHTGAPVSAAKNVAPSRNRRQVIRANLLPLGLSALALGLTIAVGDPLRTYTANSAEFTHGFFSYLPQLVLVALAIAIGALAVAISLPNAWVPRASAFYFGLAICVWIQSSFLVWEYGVFDGKGIEWDTFSWQSWLDLIVWAAILVASIVFAPRIIKQIPFLASAFIVLQLAFAFGAAATSEDDVLTKSQTEAPDEFQNIVRYSSSLNVVHIVFDALQTDVFLEVIDEDNLARDLDGFTVFRDNLSACAWTQLCLPTIFGGEVYDGTITTHEFIQRSIEERGLPTALYNEGYVVNLVPFLSMEDARHTHYLTSPRRYGKSQQQQVLEEQTHLADISLFRQLPHLLRRWVYNDGNWRLSAISEPPSTRSFHQKAFFADYIGSMRAEGTQPAYHFVHIFPPHLPYVTNTDGTFAGQVLPNTRENYKTESRFVIHLFADLVRRLKRLGLYDQSLIVLQGDHGSTHPPVFDDQTVAIRQDGYAGLLAVKRPGDRDAWQVSDAPTSHADIPVTVATALALKTEYPGTSVFDLSEGQPRDRYFFEPLWEDNELRRYRVNGSVHELESWEALPPRRIGPHLAEYAWGERVIFGIVGNSGQYIDQGWSFPDEGFIWTSGKQANVRFKVDPPPRNVALTVRARPFIVPGRHPRQRVRILANGFIVSEWEITSPAPVLSAVISMDVLNQPELNLEFELLDAASPKSINVGSDDRELGLAISSIQMNVVRGVDPQN